MNRQQPAREKPCMCGGSYCVELPNRRICWCLYHNVAGHQSCPVGVYQADGQTDCVAGCIWRLPGRHFGDYNVDDGIQPGTDHLRTVAGAMADRGHAAVEQTARSTGPETDQSYSCGKDVSQIERQESVTPVLQILTMAPCFDSFPTASGGAPKQR